MEWRATFFEESELFAPIREAASRFSGFAAFPSPEEIDAALAATASVRFVRKHQRDKALYDARIVLEGVVPTRAGSWHDFLNALVWATFPLSKMALHRRQHAIVVRGAPRRTPEGDALAMVDEGGVFCPPTGELVVFGHAIYEGRVIGRPALGAGLVVDGGRDGLDEGTCGVDARAAAILTDRTAITSPRDLLRIELEV